MSKRRYKLNSKQVELLKIIYTFRFANADLLARFRELSRSSINYSLKILLDRGLINRLYDNRDRLEGRPAVYYLESKGYRLLMDNSVLDDKPIKIDYKNRSASRKFINSQLSVMDLYIRLSNEYWDKLSFYPRADIKVMDYIPSNLIDGLFKLKQDGDTKCYFIFIVEESQYFLLNRKITKIIEYYDSREWEDLSARFPTLLFICNSDALVKKIDKKINTALANEGIEDIGIKVSSLEKVKALL